MDCHPYVLHFHFITFLPNGKFAVFDRMFSLGVRGSGVDAPPLGARVAGAAASPGLKRHFLYCSLKPEPSPTKSKQTRP